MSTIMLVLARQAADRNAFDEALLALQAANISADVIPAAEVQGRRVPAWAKPEHGGYFLRLQHDRFTAGQQLLTRFLGAAPE